MMRKLRKAYNIAGLEINSNKIKHISTNNEQIQNLTIDSTNKYMSRKNLNTLVLLGIIKDILDGVSQKFHLK